MVTLSLTSCPSPAPQIPSIKISVWYPCQQFTNVIHYQTLSTVNISPGPTTYFIVKHVSGKEW